MLGLVLTAGGARGAYQAGVLERISELPTLRGRPSPFRIVAGASAGAINGAMLAARGERFAPAADDPAQGPGPAGGTTAPATADPAPGEVSPPPAAPASAREFQLGVQRGMSLSSICKQHYGSARREIVTALARHNALADENTLREGQRLVLPSLEKLLGQKR